ncbi:methyltransferase domain-containing protein [Kribbella catacumbae]|uniref:methyltransferase domain-containing protein n=1 Tax=Kribbella catacumbae TaxID=460086 RepID=UPI00037584F1|nr:methyltransferase domain-containing protein [Kribbella catacumbae]
MTSRLLVASLNLNRGLAVPARRAAFHTWLAALSPDVLLLQETVAPQRREPAAVSGYHQVTGERSLTVWTRDRSGVAVTDLDTWQQTVDVRGTRLRNVHLAPSSGQERARQLAAMTAAPGADVVMGDFNLAPRPADGRYGDQPSKFTSAAERAALAGLLGKADLVDLLATDPPEFTFERQLPAGRSAFRCDLALVERKRAGWTFATYDHRPRAAFTDHSAVVVSVPLTGPAGGVASDVAPTAIPARTAIRRRTASPWARWVRNDLIGPDRPGPILDFGCGHGEDVRYYAAGNVPAVGYDPAPEFGAATAPAGEFAIVTMVFVLNTITGAAQRLEAVRRAAERLAGDGLLLLVTRSVAEIEAKAKAKSWAPVGDGYWSHPGRRTFQRGIDSEELRHLAACAGLVPVTDGPTPPRTAGASALLVSRQSAFRG